MDDVAPCAGGADRQTGRCGVDVVEQEPLPVGHPLLTEPNIIVTPPSVEERQTLGM